MESMDYIEPDVTENYKYLHEHNTSTREQLAQQPAQFQPVEQPTQRPRREVVPKVPPQEPPGTTTKALPLRPPPGLEQVQPQPAVPNLGTTSKAPPVKAPPIAPPPKPAQPQPVAGPQQHRPVGKHYNRPRPQQAGAILQQAVSTTDTEVDSHYCYNLTMETKVLHLAVNEDKKEKLLQQELMLDHAVLLPSYHYHDDIERYDKDLLLQAMKKELDKLRQKEMYEEVDSSTLSQEQLRKVVKTRWVVGDRPDPTTTADTTTGEVHASELRARFVAKGFSQHINDPFECYAATPSSTSLKGLLLLGILQGHQTTCLDISTAFINTPLPPTEPPIHVQPPAEWYYDQPTTLWRLRKAMYGLRTSPKLWQQHLGAVLRQQNLRQCKADRCLWTTPGLGVLIYVDDLLLVGEATKIQQFISTLKATFTLKHVTTLSKEQDIRFLGKRLQLHDDNSISISLEPSYWENMLRPYNLHGDNVKTVTTTCLEQQPLEEMEKLDPQQHKMFRTTVGQLIWASLDRPDLMYCAKLHSSRLQGPTERDLRSLKHTLRYLKGTTHYKLYIGKGLEDYLPTNHNGTVSFPQNNIPLDIRCFTDSDWAGDKTTRRSTSGWLCSLLGTPLSYASRTQQTVTLSSAEAELMALSSGMAEALHVQQLLEELQTGMCTTTFSYNNPNKKCITLYTDSTSATSLASKLGVNRRSRHIALRYLWIQDLRQSGEVDIKRVTTHENPADIYTKLLPAPVLQKHLPQNGLLALLDGEGEEECMYHLKHNNKSKNTEDKNNKVFRQDHYNNMHKTVEQYKKQNVALQQQVDELRQLVSERDTEVRDLAAKDLLPGQILRAQHALQALQDHLTEQHMRQLLGSEPLQTILGAICEKEDYDKHYIGMIDSIDPVVTLQEGQEQEQRGRQVQEQGGNTTEGETPLRQRAEEILNSLRQRRQQWRQRQQPRTTNNDDNRRRTDTPRRQGEDTTGETVENRLAIVERPEMRELQVIRRRRRRLVVATTTTLLACLSTVTTSLSQFVFTTLPFVAQQLQVASDYISWRQVERLQVIYNYSRQLSDYSWSYYNNMTTTPQQQEAAVINVETTTSPQNRLPQLKAPRVQPLGEWRSVRNYLIDNLVRAHIYGFNYSEPSRTLGLYYAQFAELQLPSASDDDSDSEEEVASMVETHNMWSPFHYDYVQDPNPPRTYYICVGESELRSWEDTHRTTLRLAGWKATTSRVFQHIHLHEHPIEALNYIIALIHNSMSTTLPPWEERLFLLAFNLFPAITTGRHLMEYYNRDGSEYKELENHSDCLQGLDTFTTSTTVIGGPTYSYVRDMMTQAFYKKHLIDVTTISGSDHYYMKSIKNMYHRHYDETVEFLQENHPGVLRMLQNEDEATTGDSTTTTGKKKGVRTTTITADYEVEIIVKQPKKG